MSVAPAAYSSISPHSGSTSLTLVARLSGVPLGRVTPSSIILSTDSAVKSFELDAMQNKLSESTGAPTSVAVPKLSNCTPLPWWERGLVTTATAMPGIPQRFLTALISLTVECERRLSPCPERPGTERPSHPATDESSSDTTPSGMYMVSA